MSDLDRHERLEDSNPAELGDEDLVFLCEEYLKSHEQPSSFFSGDNRMASLMREALKRWAPKTGNDPLPKWGGSDPD